MKKTVKQLVDEAIKEIETLSIDQALGEYGKDEVTFVDLRDIRELEREGQVPGAVHAPRGMLEFWVDPQSPYHRELFASGNRFVFFCAAGWRSALATKSVQDMGLEHVCHIEGGYGAWKEAGGAIEERAARKPKK